MKRISVLLLITILVLSTLSGCGKKGNKDDSKDGSGGGNDHDVSEEDSGFSSGSSGDTGTFGDNNGALSERETIYGSGQSIQLDGSPLYVIVEDGEEWIDTDKGLSDGEKYISIPVKFADYEGNTKEIPDPNHVYLSAAYDKDGNDLEIGKRRRPVTDIDTSLIESNAEYYYNRSMPIEVNDQMGNMVVWALYKVPEETAECIIEIFLTDDFKSLPSGAFSASIGKNENHGTFEGEEAASLSEKLSTDEKPTLEDFDFYTGDIRKNDDYLKFPNRHADYTCDNYFGGWKAYAVYDADNENGKFEAHLGNIYIDNNFEQEEGETEREVGWFDIRYVWYLGFDADGNVIDESGKEDIVIKHAYFTYNRMNNEEDGYPNISFSIDYGAYSAYGRGLFTPDSGHECHLVVVRPDGTKLNTSGEVSDLMPGSHVVKKPASMSPTSSDSGSMDNKKNDSDNGQGGKDTSGGGDNRSGSAEEEHFGPAAAARQKNGGNSGGDEEFERDPDFDGTGSGGYGVSTSGDYKVGSYDGKGHGPSSLKSEKAKSGGNDGGSTEGSSGASKVSSSGGDDGGYPSDENGYIDWSGEYYAGSKTYVISGSDKEYLSPDSIKSMDDKALRLAINEIYARHGRKFNDKELQEFFNGKDWYSPKYSPDEFDKKQNSILNDVEKENIKVLTAERKRRG